MAYLHSIAREVPAFSVSNEEAAAILEPTFREAGEDLELLRQIFRNAAIDRRYLARPPEFYGETRDLTTRNRVYHEVASELGTRASARAIEAAGTLPDHPGWLIYYAHDIQDEPTQWGCTPAQFERVCEAVEASGAQVMTMAEAVMPDMPDLPAETIDKMMRGELNFSA